MAKLTRKHQKLFAGDVPATNVVAQFGSMKAGAPAYSSDPDTIQALAAWGAGWASAVITNNAPAIQDFNAVFFVLSRALAYAYQTGVAEYNAATPYYIGSLVSDGVGGLYVSLADDNTGNALTDASKWMNFYSKKVTPVTGAYTVLNADWFVVFTDSVDTGEKVTLPTPSAANVGREIIVKLTGSSLVSQLGIDVTGGSTIDGSATIYISQWGVKRLISDGTNWHII
jgi:hypothetical protein